MKWIALMAALMVVLACGCDDNGAGFDAEPYDAEGACEEVIEEAQTHCGGEAAPLRDPFVDLCESVAECGREANDLVGCVADCYICWDGPYDAATYYVACMDECAMVYLPGLAWCWTGVAL